MNHINNPYFFLGFGYRGEKLQRTGFTRQQKRLITTIYDDKTVTDPAAPLLRRHESTWMKHK